MTEGGRNFTDGSLRPEIGGTWPARLEQNAKDAELLENTQILGKEHDEAQ